MTGSAPEEVIAFDSATHPARLANDPDASESESGRSCLELVLDVVRGPDVSRRGTPGSEGSGWTQHVVVSGVNVVVHLTWFPAGPPRGATRDVWTLQFLRARDGLMDLFRDNDSLANDPAAQRLGKTVFDALRSRSDEFSDVRWCSWRDLES